MHDSPKLRCTRDYTLFEMHATNRPVHEDKVLLASMRKYGFMPSSPIQCVKNGQNKLKVIRGHHRLDYAKRLGLPVWYIVDNTKTDIFDLEGGKQGWNFDDFLHGRASDGDADCARVLEFQRKHGLTLGAAASLLGGESAGSSNKSHQIKTGTYRVAANTSHAEAVGTLVDYLKALGVRFATTSAFVAALSTALRVPEFDVNVFRHRALQHPALMQKHGTRDEYLEEIDGLYNHGARSARFPLAFRAKALSRARQATALGKHKAKGEKV